MSEDWKKRTLDLSESIDIVPGVTWKESNDEA